MDLELVALDRWPNRSVLRVEEMLLSCVEVGRCLAVVLSNAEEHDHPPLTVEARLPGLTVCACSCRASGSSRSGALTQAGTAMPQTA